MRIGSRLTVAIVASAAVVLAAPFVGDIRAAIQAAFPGQYRAIVMALVAGAVVVAIAGAALQIRDRRPARFGLLVVALLIGSGYALATGTGNPEVDAVERFHFVEYGVLAVLYHRVWRDRDHLLAFALPMLAGLLVGTADEWLQWLVPFRVGELRDVLLNGVALGCGLLFGAAVSPPSRFRGAGGTQARRVLARLTAVTITAIAAFFHTVHLGHEVLVAPDLRFLSRFSSDALADASRDRTTRWAGPPVERRLSREDHYLSEARWHIEERNEAVAAGDMWTAWNEQRILDVFYAPVMAVLPDVRWPPNQRSEIEARARQEGVFNSSAHAHPIYPWSPALFWLVVAATVLPIAWAGGRPATAAMTRQQPA